MKNELLMHCLTAALIFLLLLISSGCLDSWECGVSTVQEINGLRGEKTLIAYIRDCGATTDYTLNVSFKHPGLDLGKETGGVFFASHGSGIILQKVSLDTVRVIYAAADVRKMKEEVDGIYFIYEKNSKIFSPEDTKLKP